MGSIPIKVPDKIKNIMPFFFYGMLGFVVENVCLSIHLSTYLQILLMIIWVEDIISIFLFFQSRKLRLQWSDF